MPPASAWGSPARSSNSLYLSVVLPQLITSTRMVQSRGGSRAAHRYRRPLCDPRSDAKLAAPIGSPAIGGSTRRYCAGVHQTYAHGAELQAAHDGDGMPLPERIRTVAKVSELIASPAVGLVLRRDCAGVQLSCADLAEVVISGHGMRRGEVVRPVIPQLAEIVRPPTIGTVIGGHAAREFTKACRAAQATPRAHLTKDQVIAANQHRYRAAALERVQQAAQARGSPRPVT